MANNYYENTTNLQPGTKARAEDINARMDSVEAGFEKLPDPNPSAPGTKGFNEAFTIVDATESDHPASAGQVRDGELTYSTDTGTADNYIATLPQAPLFYPTGMEIKITIANTNTGACTLNVNGLGAKSIKRITGDDPQPGDLVAGRLAGLRYDGTNFVILDGMYAVHSHGDLYASKEDLDNITDGTNADTAHNHSRLMSPDDLNTGISAKTGGNVQLANGVEINEFSADGNMADNSDLAVPTERAVKTYVDNEVASATSVPTGKVPVGTIVAWIGGYFGNDSNETYNHVLGNTVSAVNSQVNGDGWYVCDGSPLNDAESPIFNGAGRYLPNLTDDRFIMGDTAAGLTGGNSTMSHTHTVNNHAHGIQSAGLSTNQLASHSHGAQRADVQTGSGAIISNDSGSPQEWWVSYTGSGWGHNHGCNNASPDTGDGTYTENRPKFLGAFYLMRVK